MNFETGNGEKHNQRSLRPVPETLKSFININFTHFSDLIKLKLFETNEVIQWAYPLRN